MTRSQFNALLDGKVEKKKNKFGAKKTEYKNRTYDSAAEAKRAYELDALTRTGEIISVEYQPVYDIVINGELVCKYKADFRIHYTDGRVVVEDVKGYKGGSAYAIFRIKKKLVKAVHGVDIIEV